MHKRKCFLLTAATLAAATSAILHGQRVITDFTTVLDAADQTQYTVPGAEGSSFDSTTDFTLTFGNTGDDRLTSVTTGSGSTATTYNVSGQLPTDVGLRRNTNASNNSIPANRQVLWYRRDSTADNGNTQNLAANRTQNLTEALGGNIINRGTDNMLQNGGDGSGNENNIERVDFTFNKNAVQPQNQAQLDGVGFSILERGGNDNFTVAAITGVDANGTPSSFADPVSVNSGAWDTNESFWAADTLVVRGDDPEVSTEYNPSASVTGQSAVGLFLTLSDFGLAVGETMLGYAIMGGDVNATVGSDLLDVTDETVFPTDTNATDGGLDLVSGGSGIIEENLDTSGMFQAVPEPRTYALLLGLAALVIAGTRRIRRN